MTPTETTTLRKGARIQTSGAGRTARWRHRFGTVTRRRGGRIFVQWDGLRFEDEVDATEIVGA